MLITSISCSKNSQPSASILIHGSSTVFPITEAVAEEFQKVHPSIRVSIGVSGTGGGFKKFIKKEIDINNASRKIKSSEMNAAKENATEFIEIPVAHDGIAVVVNNKNTWVDNLTVKELQKIWRPGSQVTYWSDVRSEWPKKEIHLYGPGTASGTFDYFTEAINGKSQKSRADFTKSEDDNILVIGVSGDEGALGYFGFAYYVVNKSKIRAVPIIHKNGPVSPTDETIKTNSYSPLSRDIYIYVNKDFIQKREEIYSFVKFYLEHAKKLVKEVGYTPLKASSYQESLTKIKKLIQ